jgi:predicted helicase
LAPDSRTPIAITILIRKPGHRLTKGHHNIITTSATTFRGEEKLAIIQKFGSIDHVPWTTLQPNHQHGVLVSMRNEGFTELIPLATGKRSLMRKPRVRLRLILWG